jgi:gamma-glutamylcyclotransferase (GGCT)/AIG2-like uncharacterized protein YtfP
LFVYGSLVDPACLDRVIGHKHPGERLSARLPGYARMAPSAYAYPVVIESAGHWVDGILVMDLTRCDMQALDRYEEVDSGVYQRQSVEVEAWGCGPRPLHVMAQTYVAGPALIASTAS